MYSNTYSPETYVASSDAANSAFFAMFAGFTALTFLFSLALGLIVAISMWRLFVKAGKPGWAALVPIYNTIVMLEIARRPIWWLVMFFIPMVNLVFAIMLTLDLAKAYGRDTVYGVLMLLFPYVMYPVLAFSSKTVYTAPAGEGRVDTLGTPVPTSSDDVSHS